MANTEKFGVIGVDGIRSTETWGTVREDSSAGGNAWSLGGDRGRRAVNLRPVRHRAGRAPG